MNESVVPDFKIPVFAPNLEDFRNFKSYVEKLERFYSSAGLVKVSEVTTFLTISIVFIIIANRSDLKCFI